jgi:hypothetical protein
MVEHFAGQPQSNWKGETLNQSKGAGKPAPS